MAESWEVLVTCADQFSAEALAGQLRNDGIPVDVRVESSIPGLVSAAYILVPSLKVDRARWIVGQSRVSDEELWIAATGETITPDEALANETYEANADRHQMDTARGRSPYTNRLLFVGLMAGAAFCYWASLHGWSGPWRGASGLLFSLASLSGIWALIEALVAGRPRKSN